MKKIWNYILIFAIILASLAMPTDKAYAADLSMSVSSSEVKIGDEVVVSITVPAGISADINMTYPGDLLTFSSASSTASDIGGVVAFTIGNFGSTSTQPTTGTITFKAKSSGQATFSATVTMAGDSNGDPVQVGGASKTISIVNEAVVEPTKSNDNSLAVLKLSSGTLSPAFKYNVTNYTATVDYNVTRVDITAQTSNAKAVIESMSGNENLQVGENTITIVVRAENGVKATYKIVVTRNAQGTNTPGPTETEGPEVTPGTIVEGSDSGFTWNGGSLLFTEEVPTEIIPTDFTKESMMMNNMEIPCLKFGKGDITLLYLKDTQSNGGLYVYDKSLDNVSPFIKLQSESTYVIVLEPGEVSMPDGYEICSLSIEGKGVVTACRFIGTNQKAASTLWFGQEVYMAAEPAASDFYLIYCINNAGEYGWYQYDAAEKTFQRYVGDLFGNNSSPSNNTNTGTDVEVQGNESGLAAQLKAEKEKNLILICVFAFVAAVLLVVIFNLILLRRKSDNDFEDEISEEDLELLEEEISAEADKIVEEISENKGNAEDDEIEIEFYEMAEEMPVEESAKEESAKEESAKEESAKEEPKTVVKKEKTVDESGDDFKFIDL